MFQQLALQQAQQNFLSEGNFGFGELVEGRDPDSFHSSTRRSGSSIDWNSIINRGFDLGSQFMQSYGGKTVGTQTFGSGGQVFAVNTPGGYDNTPGSNQNSVAYQNMLAQQALANAQAKDGIAEDLFGSITSFISKNPLPVFGGILALYLLMKEPPKRR